jgi:hypothetical protein
LLSCVMKWNFDSILEGRKPHQRGRRPSPIDPPDVIQEGHTFEHEPNTSEPSRYWMKDHFFFQFLVMRSSARSDEKKIVRSLSNSHFK